MYSKLEMSTQHFTGLSAQARKHASADPFTVNTQVRDRPWLLNPGQMSPEVQNTGISDPTKRIYVLQKLRKKSSTVQNIPTQP